MRKLLFLFIGVLVAFAANAVTYVNVLGDFNSWGDNGKQPDASGITKHENLTIGTKGFKVKVWDGSDHWYSTGGAIQQNQWITISGNNDNNMTIAGATDGQKFDVEWNVNNNQIRVTPVGGSSTASHKWSNTLWIKGNWDGTNWGAFSSFSYDETNKYWTATINVTQTNFNFGLFDGDASHNESVWYGGSNIDTATKTEANYDFAGSNGIVRNCAVGAVTVILRLKADGNSGTLEFVDNGGDEPQPGDATLYLSHDITGTWEHGIEMNKNGNKFTKDINIEKDNGWVCFSKDKASNWDTFGIRYGAEGGEQNVTETSTYNVTVSDNCWKLTKGKWNIEVTFDGTTPKTVKFTKDGGDDPQPVTKPTTLYMHFKYDLENKGVNGANTVPYAYVYNTETGVAKTEWNDEASKMTKVDNVNNRYSLWKFELDPEDVDKYNAVVFHFQMKGDIVSDWDGTIRYSSVQYKASGNDVSHGNVEGYDKDNWTKYIYATASKDIKGDKEYAIQSFITYDEFKARDDKDTANGGREKIFLIGWDGIQADAAETGSFAALPDDIKNDLLALNNDHGCFYLPVKSTGDNARFKVSWIQPNDYAQNIGSIANGNARAWATFDLGLVGVNKNFESNGWKPNYDAAGNGKVYAGGNKSVPYMNYDQADWVMQHSTFGDNSWYLIIDTHTVQNSGHDCKTITIASFDPHSTVETTVSAAEKYPAELDAATAAALSDGERLHAADANGHVDMTKVNYATGEAKITATDLSGVRTTFTREYSLYVNEQLVGTTKEDAKSLKIDYLPISQNGKISVRAMFTDANTGLTFHSRIGECDYQTNVEFQAPAVLTLTGKYVWEHNNADGTATYGVYVEGMDVNYEHAGLHGYADYEFDCGENAELLKSDSPLINAKYGIEAWGLWDNGNDWSTNLRLDRESAPLFIHNVQDAATVEELKNPRTIRCTLYAVYPFIYDPDATLQVISASGAPKRIGARAASNDLSGLKITHTYVPTVVQFDVPSGNTVTGIEDITTEAEGNIEFFNLQGVRVEGELTPGVYIRRQGSTTSKVYIR